MRLSKITFFLLLWLGLCFQARADMLLTGVGGAIATPDQVLGSALKAWYLGDSAGNTISAGRFSAITDASGSNNPLTGAGGTQNPDVSASPINGHQSFGFQPAGPTFANTPNASHPGINALPYYLFGCLRPRANATKNVQRNWFGSQGGGGNMRTLDDGSSVTLSFYNGGASSVDQTGLANATVYCFTAKIEASLMTLRVNSLAAVTNAGVGAGTFTESIIGTNGGFGANDSADGQGLEFGVANIAPTTVQDNAIMAYLLNRAGL